MTLGARFAIAEDLVIEVPVAPEALASRLRSRLNQRPKRALGILKVSDEWIGVVHGNEFAVWERRQHAMRAQGRIRAVRGGSRVEARISLTRRSAVLMVVFFALFAVGAVGILSRPEGLGISPATLVLVGLAVLGTLLVFWVGSLRQRAALRAFLADVFRDAP
ncbi:MAG: hypothetical protein ACRDGT_00385 [Candidatus Limnocylindria bacterium]